MNTVKIFQNSWNLMLRYRALWIFGVILAFTTVSIGSALWSRRNGEPRDRTLVNWEISAKDQAWIRENYGFDLPLRYTVKVGDLAIRLDNPSLSPQERTRMVNIAKTAIAVMVVLVFVILVLRYTAEAALICMVNDRQNNGEKQDALQGWRYGFSIKALRLFLIDLVVYPLLLTLTVLIFLPALLPVLIAINGSPAGITIGGLLMISFALVCLSAVIVIWGACAVTLDLARRACCLEGLGVFASIWRGFHLLRSQLRGVGSTWIALLGLELVYPILVAPVGILLAAVALAVSGLLGYLLGALLSLFLVRTTAWTIALIFGSVLLALAVIVPMALLSGLREVFKSSAWTLTFGEAANRHSSHSELSTDPGLPLASTA